MIKICLIGDKAEIYSEYNQGYVSELKRRIGGARWEPAKGCWIIPEQSVDTCRELLMKYFGENDLTEEAERFSVKFKYKKERIRGPVTVFGRSLATAYERDGGARLGNDFEIVDGKIGSGGSQKYWTSWADGVFIAHNVTQKMLDNEYLGEDLIEIIRYNDKDVDVESLTAEKERLLARLQEIEEILDKKS